MIEKSRAYFSYLVWANKKYIKNILKNKMSDSTLVVQDFSCKHLNCKFRRTFRYRAFKKRVIVSLAKEIWWERRKTPHLSRRPRSAPMLSLSRERMTASDWPSAFLISRLLLYSPVLASSTRNDSGRAICSSAIHEIIQIRTRNCLEH